jgi:hypothetical protein
MFANSRNIGTSSVTYENDSKLNLQQGTQVIVKAHRALGPGWSLGIDLLLKWRPRLAFSALAL